MDDWNNLYAYAPSSLSNAASKGEVVILQELLAAGKNPNAIDHRGWTALHVAAANDQLECIRVLLKDSRTNPMQRSHKGETAAEIAVIHKSSLAVVQLMLEKVGRTGMKPTMLHVACCNGTIDIVKLLVQHKADINIHEEINFQTPLHCAAEGKHPHVIQYLLDQGAKVNAKDSSRCTPLFEAVQQNSLECVQILLDAGSKVNSPTSDGFTPLMMSCQKGNLEMVKLLVSHGADPNIVALDYSMAITYAAHGGYSDVVKFILPLTNRDRLAEVAIAPQAGSVSLFCMTLDSESDQCLSILLEADLGCEVKRWPLYRKLKDMTPNIRYSRRSPMSFLLLDKMYEFGDRMTDVLRKLINARFPVNVSSSSDLPPLVAALLFPLLQPPAGQLNILEVLIEAGANVDYRSQSSHMLPDAILAACLKCNGPALKVLLPHSTVSPHHLLEYFIEGKSTIFCYFLIGEASLGDDFSGLDAKVGTLVQNSSNCVWMNFLPRLREKFPTLQGIARRKVRETLIKSSKNTQEFLLNISDLNIPNALKDYLRFKT